MNTTQSIGENLDSRFPLTDDQIAFYQENGFIKLKHVLAEETLRHYREAISAKVAELNTQPLPLEKRTTYDKAFLQVKNLWTESALIRELIFSKRLARIATELMGCRGVRLYHDQALYKEPGGGFTPWHADQYYWPVSNDNTVTAWIPLQDTPLAMGPLAFSPRSHRFQLGRDLEISDKSETTLKEALAANGMEESPFELGDVSFHSGWTFHRAGANTTQQPREVMTIIYMDEDMRLAKPKNKNQIADMECWCPSVSIGEVIASPLNPVLYTREQSA